MNLARLIAGAGVLLVLGGCSHPATTRPAAPAPSASLLNPVPEPTSAEPSPAAALPSRTSVAPRSARTATEAPGGGLDQFVLAVQKQVPEVALDRRDEEVEALGEQVCASLAGGATSTAVASEVTEQGVAAADARKLVHLARTTACRGRPKV